MTGISKQSARVIDPVQDRLDREAFEEAAREFRLQRQYGELDTGSPGTEPPDPFDQEGIPDRVELGGLGAALPAGEGTCLYRLVKSVGLTTFPEVTRVCDIEPEVLERLKEMRDGPKVFYVAYSKVDSRNHVECVSRGSKTGSLDMEVLGEKLEYMGRRVMAVTNFQNFFVGSSTNRVFDYHFYATAATADPAGDDEHFGADIPLPPRGTTPGVQSRGGGHSRAATTASGVGGEASRAGGGRAFDQGDVVADLGAAHGGPPLFGFGHRAGPPSVVDAGIGSGSSNVNGGVTRPKRRVVGAKTNTAAGWRATKGYRPVATVMFNNVSELFLDSMSREYAQEIIEEVFGLWGIPLEDSEATKYAEDLIWAFLVAVTASNKADYEKEFEVPVPSTGTSVLVSMQDLSDVITVNHGMTRRRFARAVANDVKGYLMQPDNITILPTLAARAGCPPQYANLAFDGSTHCSSLTTDQLKFVKLLESRNLFEDDSVIAAGASGRLMEGINSGVRSKVER